ncbi:MAG: dioxygenase [Rhodocyclaceae bacterium]|nr:dioxygenase [Rhodocyclaceae bacterium]
MDFPTLFISHGAPSFALHPGQLGPQLTALGQQLPRPRAVLVMSPHWSTRALSVDHADRPGTLHDFGGFERALYALDYPAPGAPEVAAELVDALAVHGFNAQGVTTPGRDHGCWVPLMHLYPAADVPVLRLSQPFTPSPLALLELGRAVATLRTRGVLIVGSGALTHNLRDLDGGDAPASYATEFGAWMGARIAEGDLDALLNYRYCAPAARRAHPTDEHLLPLFFAIGAAGGQWTQARRLAGGLAHDAVNMDSFIFAAAPSEPRTAQSIQSIPITEMS